MEIWAGLPFNQKIRPMPAYFDLPDGPSEGLVMGAVRSWVRVDRSATLTIDGQPITPPFAGDAYDVPAPTQTGLLDVTHQGYDAGAQFDITATGKVTILGLNREVEVGG
jgi:hypothetical protein